MAFIIKVIAGSHINMTNFINFILFFVNPRNPYYKARGLQPPKFVITDWTN